MSKKILYDFEGFRVDIEQNCLWRGEELISLTPKAFQTLVVLIKNKGRVMSKNALLDEIWKDTFVEESTLAQNISTLRKTLAKYDREGKEFIATVPRRGYRFVAEVTEISSDEEVLYVEKRSVTHIVAEQEEIDIDGPPDAVAVRREDAPASARTGFFKGKMLFGIAALAAAAILLAGFLLVSLFSPAETFYQTKFRNFRLNTLFSERNIGAVAVSPDGKYVAVVRSDPAGDEVVLKQTAAGNPIEILSGGAELTVAGIAFSPGAEYIYYAAYRNRDPAPKYGKLYRVPALGGAPQEILHDIDSPPAISADGQKIAFVRNKLEAKQTALVIAGADGGGEKELAVRDLRSGFSTSGLSFSPDGRLISIAVADREDERRPVKLITIDTETGEQKTLAAEEDWLWIGQTIWLRDGSGVALVAYGSESPNLTDEIWFVSYPEGRPRVITNGLKGINGLSLTDDLSSIVATRQNRVAGLFVGPANDPDRAAEIARTAEAEELLPLGADWTAAGEEKSGGDRLVYARTGNGSADIWMINPDGSKPRQLTSSAAADFAPAATADGRYIFFLSNRGPGAAGSIWRMTADGADQTEIIRARFLFPPTVSGKNDFIYYSAKSADKPHNVLWRADLDGKNARELTSVRTFAPRVSPDGRYVFCFYPDAGEDPEDLTKPLRLTVLRAADGRVFRQYAALKNRRFPIVEWRADSSGFLFIEKDNGRTTLFSQPLAGGDPETVKKWADEDIYQIALSRDGRRLFFEKGREVTSVVELKDLSE